MLFVKKNPRAFGTAMAALLLASSMPVTAEVYQYRDHRGHVYLTDRPMKGGYHLIKRYDFGNKRRSGQRSGTLAAMERRRSQLDPLIRAAARNHQLSPELVHAVVRAESAYRSDAVSRKGAQGLMQLMPATADRFGVRDSFDPRENLHGGTRYLKKLLGMFDGDLSLALAAYNAGENAVAKYGNQIPPYPETQKYVKKVLTFYRKDRSANQVAQR